MLRKINKNMRNLSFLLLLFLAVAWTKPTPKPNIIFIYADDLGYNELGCYGQKKILTPNLDQLASEGMKFTQFYTSTPVCAPARCALLTGKHTGHTYIRGNYELGGFADSLEGGQMPLHPNAFTVGHLMKKAGYQTACIGKWGLGMANTSGNPNDQGFDYFYGYLDQKQAHNYYPTHLWENGQWDKLNNHVIDVYRKLKPETATDEEFAYFRGKEYAVDKLGEKAQKFIKDNQKQPFFLYLPYTTPHISLQAPEAAVKEYIGKFDEKPYYGQNGYASTPYPYSTYAAMITYMDKQIGDIRRLLKDLNLDENTIIMFSSDNGATFAGGVNTKYFESVGNLKGLKMEVYEGGIREPLIAYWKNKIPKGTTTNQVAIQYDLMATLGEIIGEKDLKTDGVSFLPTLMGKENQQKKHDFFYWEYPENGGQIAIRIGNWKGVKMDMKKNKNAKWELYDLEKDVSETTNLAAQNPEIIKRLDEILKQEHTPAHVKDWEFVMPKF